MGAFLFHHGKRVRFACAVFPQPYEGRFVGERPLRMAVDRLVGDIETSCGESIERPGNVFPFE